LGRVGSWIQVRLYLHWYYDQQINAALRDKILSAVHCAFHDKGRDLDSTKDLWDRIVIFKK
jgi:hypothetical protein